MTAPRLMQAGDGGLAPRCQPFSRSGRMQAGPLGAGRAQAQTRVQRPLGAEWRSPSGRILPPAWPSGPNAQHSAHHGTPVAAALTNGLSDRPVPHEGPSVPPRAPSVEDIGDIGRCPWCGLTGPGFADAPMPADYCDHPSTEATMRRAFTRLALGLAVLCAHAGAAAQVAADLEGACAPSAKALALTFGLGVMVLSAVGLLTVLALTYAGVRTAWESAVEARAQRLVDKLARERNVHL